MKTWAQRLRHAVRMGLAWGAAWFVGGILLARVPGFYSDLPFALVFAPLGFAAGIMFSGIRVILDRRRGFDPASPWQFGGWGAVSGLLLSGIIVAAAALRGAPLWKELMTFAPPLAIASSICAAGSLAVARWAERRKLLGRRGSM